MVRREDALEALESLLQNAYSWKTGPLRRLKLWSDVPLTARPACYLYEGGSETYSWEIAAQAKRSLDIKLFVYLNAKDPNSIGASMINDVLDAIDLCFALDGSDQSLGRKTLGGLVYNCRIDGKVLKDPGDLDGDALLILPIKIILP